MPLEAKSVSNLQVQEVSWNLTDAQALGNIATALNADIKNEEAALEETKQQVNALIQNCKKCKCGLDAGCIPDMDINSAYLL